MLPLQGARVSIPGQGTKIPHAVQHTQKNKKESAEEKHQETWEARAAGFYEWLHPK